MRSRPRPVLRRADLRRRGLRRVGGVGAARGHQRGGRGRGRAAVGAAAHDGHRRAGVLRVARGRGATTSRATSRSGSWSRSSRPTAALRRKARRASARERSAISSERAGGRWSGSDRRDRGWQLRDAADERPPPRLPRLPAAEPQRVGAHRARLRQRPVAVPRRSWPGEYKRRRPELQPADITRPMIRGFLAELFRAGESRASAARKLAAVRAFLRYLRREGLIEADPGAAGGDAEARAADPAPPRGGRDGAPARDARHDGAARPARPRDPRTALRVGPAAERAGRARSRGREPRRRMVRVLGKGRQGAARAVQPERRGGASGPGCRTGRRCSARQRAAAEPASGPATPGRGTPPQPQAARRSRSRGRGESRCS